jgi:hypothetical protein
LQAHFHFCIKTIQNIKQPPSKKEKELAISLVATIKTAVVIFKRQKIWQRTTAHLQNGGVLGKLASSIFILKFGACRQ